MAGYKVLALSQEMFCGKFRGKHPGYHINVNPLPVDAKVVSMTINPTDGELEFVIYSEKYEFIKPGHKLPYVPVPYGIPWEEKK